MDGSAPPIELRAVPLGSERASAGSLALSHFVRQYEALPRPLCARLVEQFGRHDGQHQRQQMPGVRCFDEWSLGAAATADGLLEPLLQGVMRVAESAAERYRADVGVGPYDWPDAYRWEHVRIKRYPRGQGYFDDHVDVRNRASSCRFLAFLFYLDDVDEGGRTEFRELGSWAEPVAGRVLVFPPTWMFPHRGSMVPHADKHIMSTYLHYV